ncbi:MAG: hypothetical protein K9J45_13235, partial [Bacteroidales bacterium]|nr:hypothetical protein [Bacteroidales bacterium]
GAHTFSKEIFDEIQNLEVEIALACMGHGDFLTDFGSRLEAWEASFFQLQVKIHSLVSPKRDTCWIGLYGLHLEEALQFYLSLFKAKNFEIKAMETVWFREGYTGEASGGKKNAAKAKEKNAAYFYQSIQNPEDFRLASTPAKPGDLCCGVEIAVNGPSAWLYLKEEKGFQLWSNKELLEPFQLFVLTALGKIKTPAEIHRQAFYLNGKARRQVTPVGFSDSKLELATNLPPVDNVPLLVEKLDAVYKKVLTRAFLDDGQEE